MDMDRRSFMRHTGALVVGFSWSATPTDGQAAAGLLGPDVPPGKPLAKDEVESFVALGPDGSCTVYVGKVDLGTGTRTALMQIAADELEVPFERIELVMGDTATTPDQWMTGANLTIQQGGLELRRACATARHTLRARAARRLGVAPEQLQSGAAAFAVEGAAQRRVDYASLVAEQPLALKVDPKAALKPPAEHKHIGRSVPRVDIPAKLTGEFTFIHDLRLPGMLHARVVRADEIDAELLSFDDSAARKVGGFERTVHKGNFLAVVARTEWAAVKAMRAMKAQWKTTTVLPQQEQVFDEWRARPLAKQELTQNVGDVPAALQGAARRVKARYDFAVQTHASMGPSCAVAEYRDGRLTVWTPSQATHSLVSELEPIVGLPKDRIRCIYVDGAGCYGRNGHEDASADAALISRVMERPVRVQWMRADETARAPKSPPRSMDLEAGLDAQGNVVGWSGDFWVALNHIVAFKPLDFPLLAAREVGVPRPGNWVGFLFQNAGIGYGVPNIRVQTRHVAETFFRSAHLRSPGRIENSFANESFIDELAFAAGADPAEYRQRLLKDPRALQVIERVLQRAGWQRRVGIQGDAATAPVARGRGIAYLRYNNATTYVAAVAEVKVDRRTGQVRVERVCVAHDCGQIVNPDGVVNQVEGGVIQTVSRTLVEQVNWTRTQVKSVDWITYPILRHDAVPRVEVDLINRPGEPSLGAGEPTACAIPAAIGNAIFDATGARLRAVPFTPARVLEALARPVGA
jgi:nicotinate dehydrogenase subunit B